MAGEYLSGRFNLKNVWKLIDQAINLFIEHKKTCTRSETNCPRLK